MKYTRGLNACCRGACEAFAEGTFTVLYAGSIGRYLIGELAAEVNARESSQILLLNGVQGLSPLFKTTSSRLPNRHSFFLIECSRLGWS